MISYITGTIKGIQEQKLIIDVGGIGISLHIPSERVFMIGSQVTLHAYMHWNQEQGPSLYGFANEHERTIFLLVISCSGIGPKIGLALLEQMSPAAFLEAVNTGNVATLSKVSGIGAKKAEHIIVQLRHKVTALIKSGTEIVTSTPQLEQWNNVAQVLESLNYTRAEINHAMKHLGDTYTDKQVAFDQLMRQALSFMSRKGASMHTTN